MPRADAARRGRAATLRRILVALDNSPSSLAAAEAAAELAVATGAELIGLFVEDDRLLGVSSLPGIREFDVLTATSRPIGREELEGQLRASAYRAREAFAQLAEEIGARWSFRITRGRVGREIVSAATGADLVSLGRVGWSLFQRHRLGSTALHLVESFPGHLLLVTPLVRISPPMLVVFDGRPEALRALRLAARLTTRWDAPLDVLLVGGDEERLRRAALRELGEREGDARFHRLATAHPDRVLQRISVEHWGLIVLPVGGEEGELLASLLRRADCPVLAVGGDARRRSADVAAEVEDG